MDDTRTGPPADDPFARIPAPGKAAAARPGAPVGRQALFTAASRGGPTSRVLQVACSRCGARTPLSLAGAIRSAVPVLLVVPLRRHPVLARCPACRRRTWLRPEVVR